MMGPQHYPAPSGPRQFAAHGPAPGGYPGPPGMPAGPGAMVQQNGLDSNTMPGATAMHVNNSLGHNQPETTMGPQHYPSATGPRQLQPYHAPTPGGYPVPMGPPGVPDGPGAMAQQKRVNVNLSMPSTETMHVNGSLGGPNQPHQPGSMVGPQQHYPATGGPPHQFPQRGPAAPGGYPGPPGMPGGPGAMAPPKRLDQNITPGMEAMHLNNSLGSNQQQQPGPMVGSQHYQPSGGPRQFPPHGQAAPGGYPGPMGPPGMPAGPEAMAPQIPRGHAGPGGFPGPMGPPGMPAGPGAMPPQPRLDPNTMPGTFNAHGGSGQQQPPGLMMGAQHYPAAAPGPHQFPSHGPTTASYPGAAGPPGMPGMPGGPGTMAQQKRLDPNMMPSAVQVIDDDRKAHGGVFATGYPRAELPPLVTTDFISEDHGNCNPKFIRSTLYTGPINSDLLKQCAIPFALTISPIAQLDPRERPLPAIDMGELGPVRCHRCKAYMCPYMEFNFGGRRFFCPFCKATTDVPTEYFAHLDQNGQRTDICDRPELCLASYEFIATKEYCKNNIYPKSPAFIFMLDVSYNAVRTGIVKLFCENIKTLLQNLPKEANAEKSEIKVGFATYDQTVHFYSLKSALGQPKMLIISDVQDTFVPIVDGFLVDLHEAESIIDILLAQIPQIFAESKITEIVLGPVIQAGMDALKSADRAGKLFIFHSSLPTFEAPGVLKNRDDKQIIGTDKEKAVLLPQNEFYTKLAQDCVAVGCCIDVFLFPSTYIDVATIGAMCGLTGGQVYKYQYFQPESDGQRFLNDLKHNIERPIVFDAIMRVRSSAGIRPTDFFGNIYMQNTTDIELAALDCDKTVTVEIKHDDKIEDQSVFFQVALLFTSVRGQRKLRIHNLSLNIGTDLASLYRSADLFSILSYLTKQGERLLFQKSAREVRESLVSRAARMLATYRQHCSPSSSLGQLVLPETMKLMPLMINCVMKHNAFTGGKDLSFDVRAWLMQNVPSMSTLDMVYYFYPRIIPVHEIEDDMGEELPMAVRCAYENLAPNGAYLFDNSVNVFFWIGNQISTQWIQDVFGVQNFAQINSDKHQLPEKDNNTSRFVRKVLDKMQLGRTRCMKLFIVKQQDKLEPWFKTFIVEDRGLDGSPSYVEFLCHVHKEIRNILS